MPGTLVVGTLNNGTSPYNLADLGQTTAKAWVKFDGSTSPIGIKGSFNVSSITDNGVGNYTVNFATPLANANYVATFGSLYGTSNVTRQSGLCHNGQTTTALNVVYVYIPTNNGATLYDCPDAHIAVFGV